MPASLMVVLMIQIIPAWSIVMSTLIPALIILAGVTPAT